MKAIILLSVLAVALARECGENQHYESCGTACPLTCENYKNPPEACVLMCNPGCHCDAGYVKAKDGSCVRPEQCPAQAECGLNQEFRECGTACPLTCDNYKNPPKICTTMCVTGCHCKYGFVKTEDGRCIEPKNCPLNAPVCVGENQVFKECGTACPLTCKNYRNPPKACPAMCVTGCQCEDGYIKSGRSDERCVRPFNCPVDAPKAELCSLSFETGPCRASMPRYFYNEQTGECEKFIYGGCGGNQNNFKTVDECHNTCRS